MTLRIRAASAIDPDIFGGLANTAEANMTSVVHFSHSDMAGGAARGAFGLHRALLAQGTHSRMVVAERLSDLASIASAFHGRSRYLHAIKRRLSAEIVRMQISENPVLHSTGLFGGAMQAACVGAEEIVHLHWVCGGLLSLKEIAAVRNPVVWTLRDMWPFCGAEHYAPEDPSARWRNGYRRGNRIAGDRGVDIDRMVWRRKHVLWREPVHLVALSRWLADCAQSSALMHDWPIRVIPNALDTACFRPWPKELARQMLALPLERPIVLFGAIGGTRDVRKGWDLLLQALPRVTAAHPAVYSVVFGQSAASPHATSSLPIHYLGQLHDDLSLALTYSAADVMVVPSRQEAFGKTASEAQGCGCPVVAFAGTGLVDVIDHQHTGFLAKRGDPVDLGAGIAWVISDETRRRHLGVEARKRAIRLWSQSVIAEQYVELYEDVMRQWRVRRLR